MYTITKKDNEKVNCKLILKGPEDNMLQIYTNQLTPVQAFQFFDDPENMQTFIIDRINDTSEELEERHVMKGYTELFAVQKPYLHSTDEKMIHILLRKDMNMKVEAL